MKKKLVAMLLTGVMLFGLTACGGQSVGEKAPAQQEAQQVSAEDVLKVGFIYIGDESEPYTRNYINAEKAIQKQYEGKVQTLAKYNVSEDAAQVTTAAEELIAAGCKMIFSTSYGFEFTLVEIAAENPDIMFAQATGDNAVDSGLNNYVNYMGEIYQGRYVSGIIAGLKLQEMINDGVITADQAKMGYVAAYNFAEPISGYTAFYMGATSIVPEATMEVMYANSWGDYETEKQLATTMIEDGCVIISQHSDTSGPAEACEAAMAKGNPVYHVGYNDSLLDIAPNTSLGGSRMNMDTFEVAAVGAVLSGENFKDAILATGAKTNENGTDFWGGFGQNWVAMLDMNEKLVAAGTKEAVQKTIEAFSDGSLTAKDVFKGNHTATNPFDANDKIDLKDGFDENGKRSAPAFGYVLDCFEVK